MTNVRAYLKEWEVDGEKRSRVDLHPDCEPWLVAYRPRITSLCAADEIERLRGLLREAWECGFPDFFGADLSQRIRAELPDEPGKP